MSIIEDILADISHIPTQLLSYTLVYKVKTGVATITEDLHCLELCTGDFKGRSYIEKDLNHPEYIAFKKWLADNVET